LGSKGLTVVISLGLSSYHEQAARDAELVYRYAQVLLRQLNQSSDVISESDIRQFCKHASELHVIRGSSIAEEYEARVSNAPLIGKFLFK